MKQTAGARPPAILDGRPYCVACKILMRSKGKGRFGCKDCGASCMAAMTPQLAPAAGHPDCVRCRRAMVSGGKTRAGSPQWHCRTCGIYCLKQSTPRKAVSCGRAGAPPDPSDSRPWCIKCRSVMRGAGVTKTGLHRWRCHSCGVHCFRQSARGEVRARVGADIDLRPWCVKCRSVMRANGEGSFACATCRSTLRARPKFCHPRRHDLKRPTCRHCGRPKARAGRPGTFTCNPCHNQRRRLRCQLSNEAEAAALLKQIAGRLPCYLSPDDREDAAQSIMLDILAGKLTADGLSPATLRAYAARAVGPARDRFRFISLSAPTRDGREFGETLAA
jgi:hypothetical protein